MVVRCHDYFAVVCLPGDFGAGEFDGPFDLSREVMVVAWRLLLTSQSNCMVLLQYDEQEASALLRALSGYRLRPIAWRDRRSYVFGDSGVFDQSTINPVRPLTVSLSLSR